MKVKLAAFDAGCSLCDEAPKIIETPHTDFPAELGDRFAEFKQDFIGNALYSSSGRASLPVKTNIAKANSLCHKIIDGVGAKVLDKLDANFKPFLSGPRWFGYSPTMSACGPESSFVASLKLQVFGTRTVILCCFAELATYARSTKDPTTIWTAQDVCDVLSTVRCSVCVNLLWLVRHCWHICF